MSSSEHPMAGYQVETRLDLMRWQMIWRMAKQSFVLKVNLRSGIQELHVTQFKYFSFFERGFSWWFTLLFKVNSFFRFHRKKIVCSLSCQTELTVCYDIINLPPGCVPIYIAAGDTVCIFFIFKPFYTWQLNDFIARHFNTSFVSLHNPTMLSAPKVLNWGQEWI